MFLMLVISRLSIVRMMSAVSRIASVVSLKYAVQSTTTRSCVLRSASMTRLMPDGVISSAISGDGGASRTRMPAEWLITNVSIDSTSWPACSSSGTRSAIDLFLGFRLSRTPTSPNWKEPSTRTTFLPSSVAAATARLTATVVRPTPPLGLKTATTGRARRCRSLPDRSARPPAEAGGAATEIRLCFSRSRVWTWRIEAVSSSLLNGLTRNSRAPASIERRR